MTRHTGMRRWATALMVGASFAAPLASWPALADNKMGYQLETPEQAAQLVKSGGSLGMKVGPQEQINSEGLTFQILKVEGINNNSPAEQAGLKIGDQIIAVNSHVFPNTKTFAEYVGSAKPGQQIEIDYMPAGGGPKQAQRVGVTVGESGHAAAPHKEPSTVGGGLSTGDKIAIGLGAAAVIGCYEYNCYSRIKTKLQQEREKYQQQHPAQQPQPTTR